MKVKIRINMVSFVLLLTLSPGLSMAAMDDNPLLFNLILNELESNDSGGSPVSWNAQAWLGQDLQKLWIKTEGERLRGDTKEAEVQALYSQAFSAFWDIQIGLRHNYRPDYSQDWAVIGLQDLAPYFFEIDAAVFVGESGKTALRLEAEYELLFTQKLILTPELEVNFYGKDIPELSLGSGLSDITLGLRLRYEIRREFAPYLGLEWSKLYGSSTDFARASGEEFGDTKVVAGLRLWF